MSKRSYRTFRQPCTFTVLREAAFSDVDKYAFGIVFIRRKRHNVPTVYDDNCRERKKSWKSYRKTQFKC